MNDQDLYQILGVKRTATAAQIKAAFRKQAKMHHPDKHSDKSPEEKNAHEQQFKRATEAYEVLSDDEERAYYDANGTSRKAAKAKRDSTPMTPVEEAILNMFSQLFDPQNQDPRREKYVAKMRTGAKHHRAEFTDEANRLRKAIESIKLLQGRMTRQKEKCEVFEHMVADQLARAEATLSVAQKNIELWTSVITELELWEYRTDLPAGENGYMTFSDLLRSSTIAGMPVTVKGSW